MRTEYLENLTRDGRVKYIEGRIALIDDLHHLNDEDWGTDEEAVRVKSFAAALCIAGKGSLYINNQQYSVSPGDLLVCPPDAILQNSMTSMDFKCRCICLSPEYIQQLYLISNNNWDVQMFLERNPVLPLQPEEVAGFNLYYDLMRSRIDNKSCTHHTELISCLLMAFLYEFYDTIDRFTHIKPITHSASETLFSGFIELLTTIHPKPRMVAYYADKLCVTPKYLSCVCKSISGHTASYLINQYVLKDIKCMLTMTDKSIKEVSNELDFPNLSFFGKYVKKHLGKSPKQLRHDPLAGGN